MILTRFTAQFQSTLPHGERPSVQSDNTAVTSHFNPRSRMGSDAVNRSHFWFGIISIHAPAWGATNLNSISLSILPYFNPRSRMGSDQRAMKLRAMKCISIHAPAWGATVENMQYQLDSIISIHAPAWGATIGGLDAVPVDVISIHAPAWGATTILIVRYDII